MEDIHIHLDASTMAHLADAIRAEYRAVFNLDVTEGRAQPLVLPYSIFGAFIVPTVWLAIPHSSRGGSGWWMRIANGLVVAFVVAFNLDVTWRTASTNMACGYAAGLSAFWGIISTLHVLVWTDPQVDAARVVRRERKELHAHENRHAKEDETPHEDGLRKRKEVQTSDSSSTSDGSNDVNDKYEYVWQPFPKEASFGERFLWALDITTNFRLAGWNWSISAIPRPDIPSTTHIPDGTPVDITKMPITTPAGYHRFTNQSSFVYNRILTAGLMYIILDFLAVFMTKDPYFVLGPDHRFIEAIPLPSYFHALPSWAVSIYRQIFSMTGVLAAISGIFSLNDLMHYFLLSKIWPSRGELWQYPPTFGSFMQVLDRGLAGWWGGWWHQSFRAQFAAPTRWLLRQGYMQRDTFAATAIALLISFGQSGLLHASGSFSAVPRTKTWRSPVFFLLQVVGMLIQYGAARLAGGYFPTEKAPRVLIRAVNLVFTLGWLHFTANFFIDDLASAGIWLLEPIPFSFFRAFGFGAPEDRWWRWDEHHFPRWHSAEHWWQSGIAV